MLDVPGATNIDCQRRIWWLADHFRSYAGGERRNRGGRRSKAN